MKYVALLLHMYQPPIQRPEIVDQVVQDTYDPLSRQLAEFPTLKLSANINFSLIRHLHSLAPDTLNRIRDCYESGALEITSSGAYHPIFPLISEVEVERQLRKNDEGMRQFFSSRFAPEGVFPPELAYHDNLPDLFRRLGYRWTLADDGTMSYYGIDVPYDDIYTSHGIPVFLRSNHWSNKLADAQYVWRHGKDFVEELARGMKSWIGERDGYIVIALDGETFGHHRRSLNESFLREMFEAFHNCDLRLAHLSELSRIFPHRPQFLPPSSWSTDLAGVINRDYFSWWKSPQNRVHTLQWELTDYVAAKVNDLAAHEELRDEMDQALYSCQYWWASFWRFNADEVCKGVFNLMRILHHVAEIHGDRYDELAEGERICRELITEIELEHNRRQHEQQS